MLTKKIDLHLLVVLVSLFLIVFTNNTFFTKLTHIYPVDTNHIGFVLSVGLMFLSLTIVLLSLFSFQRTVKVMLMLILVISSLTSYFMDSYSAVINAEMIDNMMKTDMAEATDMLSLKLFVYVVLLGILPAVIVYHVGIKPQSLFKQFKNKVIVIVAALIIVVANFYLYSDYYSSFFREHKSVRYYSNPGFYLYSSVRYLNQQFSHANTEFVSVGLDAKIPETDIHRELVIFVVGETARVDRFSLNGYSKGTNPELSQQNVMSFTNFWSCGTSTAVSVPCMFSINSESNFSKSQEKSTENVLDILQHAGVNVLWLDNNSDSKGVADRVEYKSYKSNDVNTVCDVECRDIGMLVPLQDYIDNHPSGDIFIVLHQMGQHGPAYYKRYPQAFEKFTPACQSNQLETCSTEEINNAYDNSILYTDYFLSEVIEVLKQNEEKFESAMFYVSDHGESLGENGLYLHGLPKIIAPDTQQHIPAVLWISDNVDDIDIQQIKTKRDLKYTHDNIFHTILGFMEIESTVYQPSLDLLK